MSGNPTNDAPAAAAPVAAPAALQKIFQKLTDALTAYQANRFNSVLKNTMMQHLTTAERLLTSAAECDVKMSLQEKVAEVNADLANTAAAGSQPDAAGAAGAAGAAPATPPRVERVRHAPDAPRKPARAVGDWVQEVCTFVGTETKTFAEIFAYCALPVGATGFTNEEEMTAWLKETVITNNSRKVGVKKVKTGLFTVDGENVSVNQPVRATCFPTDVEGAAAAAAAAPATPPKAERVQHAPDAPRKPARAAGGSGVGHTSGAAAAAVVTAPAGLSDADFGRLMTLLVMASPQQMATVAAVVNSRK